MNQKRVGVYLGVDPTAPSLHVGHLVPMMALFWMYVHGFHAITLVAGPTLENLELKANCDSLEGRQPL